MDKDPHHLQNERLADIAGRFRTAGPVELVEPFGKGLINDTFRVRAGAGYVLQRLNPRVFPWPERIMANLCALARHLARHPKEGLRVPAPIPAASGAPFVRDEEGAVWRLLELIEGARNIPRVETAAQAREVGRALGLFHRLTAGLDPASFAVTLPGFHVTPEYLEGFTRALKRTEGAGHAPELRRAVAFIAARRESAGVLEAARAAGRIPVRVAHGDPKLDNILFDAASDRAVSLIDLDTLQPGLILNDIGDCLRSCCKRARPASQGEADVVLDLDIAEEILSAYAAQTRGLLTPEEIGLIPEAIRLIPFELGLRFLTDHLEGDRHFRVRFPGENLRKGQAQLALVGDIEAKAPQIRALVAKCLR